MSNPQDASKHKTEECYKSQSEKPKCVNCGDDHPALKKVSKTVQQYIIVPKNPSCKTYAEVNIVSKNASSTIYAKIT